MKKYFFVFFACILNFSLFAQDISFLQAWQRVVEHSDALKAKKEELQIARYKQQAAKDLYWPDITLSGTYTHLQDPIELRGSSLLGNLDKKSIDTLGEGIAKGYAQATYQEALQTGKTSIQAAKVAQESAQSIIDSLSNINKTIASSSLELVEQDMFYSSIRTTWALYTGGKIKAQQIVSQGNTNEAMAVLDLAKLNIFQDLAKLYFGVVLAQQVLNTKIDAQNSLEKHYKNALKLEKYGQIAKVERLSAQANYDNAKVQTKKAMRDLEIAHVALKNMLHVKKNIIPTTRLFINKHLPNMNSFLDKTLTSYPMFALFDAKKEQTQGLIMAKKSEYLPSLFLFGNYTLYKKETITSDAIPDWLIGIGASYNLIDSKGREGQLQAAYSTKLKVSYMYEQTKRDIQVLVEKTYRQVTQALEEYNGLESSLNLARETIYLRKKSFSQGLATSLDVVDAELFLEGVKTQRIVASYNYVTSLAKLLALSNQIQKFLNFK